MSTMLPTARETSPRVGRSLTLALLVGSIVLIAIRRPGITPSPDVLRPRLSEASSTLAAVQQNLGVTVEPFWVLVTGSTEGEVHERLAALQPALEENKAAGRISSYNLPLEIWPDPAAQQANAPVLQRVALRRNELLSAALREGFTTNGLELTSVTLNEWLVLHESLPAWPRGRIAQWLLPKFVSTDTAQFTALGLLYPTPTFDPKLIVPPPLAPDAIVSGWRLLGEQVFALVKREVPLISLGVFAIVVLALYLTFRSMRDVALSLAVLLLSGLLLLAAMDVLGWQWNLINLTALPLLLGMGIDYSIHIQLALRRLENRRRAVFQSVGRALLLAGSTSIIGFALLGTSSNLGMSSLGKICALGLTILLLVSVFLLPAWSPDPAQHPAQPDQAM